MLPRLCIWDPMWGPKGNIFHLAAISGSNNKVPFWHLPAALCINANIKYLTSSSLIQCAGSFHGDRYFGSASVRSFPQIPPDQVLFVCSNDFKIHHCWFQPSIELKKPNKYFSMQKLNGSLRVPFRDPHIMPNGKFAVVTGGKRWGCNFGNICEVEIKGSSVKVSRETILDDSMFIFAEIERPTFIHDFMFFSPNGVAPSIHIAKLGSNGLYAYVGELKNSKGCYGPALDHNLRMLYWYKPGFRINNPAEQNIFYRNGGWILEHRNQLPFPKEPVIQSFKDAMDSYCKEIEPENNMLTGGDRLKPGRLFD